MLVLIDDVRGWQLVALARYEDDRRYYIYNGNGVLAIAVCRNGLQLGVHLLGKVVDAKIGWDGGTPGFVREGDIGRRHSKITMYRVVDAMHDTRRVS